MKFSCTIVLAFILIGLVQSYPQFDFNNQDQFFDLVSSSAAPPTQQQQATGSNSPRYFSCLQSCPSTSQYNPLCGTDNVTYYNRAKFDCALQCGNNIQLQNMGACPSLSG